MAKNSKHIWDTRHNIVLLLRCFFSICAVLFAVDLVIRKKAHMPWEEWPGFYAIFGFVACVMLVLFAKYVLRPAVKRNEDYYDN
jgi:sterol desaturase/sphingolipid hydroxylase (fatty acid hydroxylase superfamily)